MVVNVVIAVVAVALVVDDDGISSAVIVVTVVVAVAVVAAAAAALFSFSPSSSAFSFFVFFCYTLVCKYSGLQVVEQMQKWLSDVRPTTCNSAPFSQVVDLLRFLSVFSEPPTSLHRVISTTLTC